MPSIYVITNDGCGACHKFKASGEYDKAIKGLKAMGISTFEYTGKTMREWNPPSDFPKDIHRLAAYLPAVIYIPDSPRMSNDGKILNASIYQMDIDPYGNISPSPKFDPRAEPILKWVSEQMSRNTNVISHNVAKQAPPVLNTRVVQTAGSYGKVIPPIHITKL